MSTLILTCAGLSTRFPGERPKWTLTHPDGRWMGAAALEGLTGYNRVVVAVRNEHARKLTVRAIEDAFAPWAAKIVCVGDTQSHVETVREALRLGEVVGPFVTKDCDNRFALDVCTDLDAWVAVASLDHESVRADNKGFVSVCAGIVQAAQARGAFSSTFLAGAYGFADVGQFLAFAEGKREMASVINELACEQRCDARYVNAYEDWGTVEDWRAYCRKFATLFVDIDGVVARSTFPPRWGASRDAIDENVNVLRELAANGRTQLVFTTSRPESMRAETAEQLIDLGLWPAQLVMGLLNAQRIVVNDVLPGRMSTCHAINIERDAPTLRRLLEELL